MPQIVGLNMTPLTLRSPTFSIAKCPSVESSPDRVIVSMRLGRSCSLACTVVHRKVRNVSHEYHAVMATRIMFEFPPC
jgi:hypothetical protein